ncbi:MAG: hypothetical protein ABEI99_04625 [Halobaculum sp.]
MASRSADPGRSGPDDHPEEPRERPSLSTALRARGRLLASGFAVGAPGGLLAVAAAVLLGEPVADALTSVFAVGTLIFGFAVLGWSGSIFAGRGIESMQQHMQTGTDWTERKSRRAMARVGGFGSGLMLAAAVTESAVLWLSLGG